MSLSPVAFIAPNYRDYKGWWLKFYSAGTTTPKTIILNSGGTTSSASKLQLNKDGFITSSGGTIVVPYITGAYDAYLFPTAAEADANNTAQAVRVADGLTNELASSVVVFDNIAEMKAATLNIGQAAMCKRYYADGDLVDGLVYEIQASATVDGFIDHALANGSIAKLVNNGKIKASQAGAESSGAINNTPQLQAAITRTAGNGSLIIDSNYILTTTLSVSNTDNISIEFQGGKLYCTTNLVNSMVTFSDCNGIKIINGKFEGANTLAPFTTGYQYHGIKMTRCNDTEIVNNEIYNHGCGGLMLVDCLRSRIESNKCYGNKAFWDIAFGYAISSFFIEDAIIVNNECYSENRYGIIVQGYGKRFVINNNKIRNKNEYGIMVYRFNITETEFLEDVTISGNIVEDISHNTDPTLSYFSGMGIYVQTCKNVSVTGNVVRNTLQGRPDQASPNRTLPPAAISINSTVVATVSGNVIDTSGIDGIDVVNVNETTLGTSVTGNVVKNIYRDGIHVRETTNCVVSSNSIEGTIENLGAGVAILSSSASDSKSITVNGNIIDGGFQDGIFATNGTGTNVESVSINSNRVKNVLNSYYQALNCLGLSMSDNIAEIGATPHTVNSYVYIANNCENVAVNGNVSYKNGAEDFKRGLALVNCTGGVATGNFIKDTSDTFYSLYLTGNTDVHVYGNRNDRQTLPMVGPHTIGDDPSTQTNIKIIYKTSIPLAGDGAFDRGSVAYNITPSASGNVGWICVASGTPGTWKEFGVIEA